MKRLVLALAVAAGGCASTESRAALPEPLPAEPPSPSATPEPPAPPRQAVAAAPGGDAVDRAIIEFQEYLGTNPDWPGLLHQIEALALRKDPRVAGALGRVYRDPKREDSVRAAACRACGSQGDRSAGAALLAFADGKEVAARPAVMAAALEGAGEADPNGCSRELLKYGKVYMDRDAVVASAAFRGAARRVSHDTVDELVQCLGRASYLRSGASPSKRAALEGVRPVLLELLRNATGEELSDSRQWTEWWAAHKKTWRPTVPGDSQE